MSTVLTDISDQELLAVRDELPEIGLLKDVDTQRKVSLVFASFLRESSYERIADSPAVPGIHSYNLVQHTRHVVKNSIYLAETLAEFAGQSNDMEDLIAAGLAHDASKLVEMEGPLGKKTELGKAFLHAQLAGVRCLEMGLSPKVAHLVAMHPFTPPHVHVTPQYWEMLILTWADLAAVDPVFFVQGQPTHLQFEKRFFRLD